MTPRRAVIICCVWLIAAIPTAHTFLLSASGFTEVAEYMECANQIC